MIRTKNLPGVNIQWPWSQLIMEGKKTVETRSYRLPEKYVGVELAIIETPGPVGKKLGGVQKASIVGTIVFSQSFQYTSKRQWLDDLALHCVQPEDPQFHWSDRPKFGWIIERADRLREPLPAPPKRGIVFASMCSI